MYEEKNVEAALHVFPLHVWGRGQRASFHTTEKSAVPPEENKKQRSVIFSLRYPFGIAPPGQKKHFQIRACSQ